MEVYPAIDLMNESVVRLRRGNPAEVSEYVSFGSPVDVARFWESQGAKMLHVIDLDAAFGYRSNLSIVDSIVTEVSIPIQVGGGLRDESDIVKALNRFAQRVILGSIAVQRPDIVIQLGEEYGFDRIVVSLDYRENQVMTNGWRKFADTKPQSSLKTFREKGVTHFLMTSVEQDGSLEGPDKTLVEISDFRSDIIVAGGISSVTDIEYLASKKFDAAVIGKALYEQKLSLPEAILAGRLTT